MNWDNSDLCQYVICPESRFQNKIFHFYLEMQTLMFLKEKKKVIRIFSYFSSTEYSHVLAKGVLSDFGQGI